MECGKCLQLLSDLIDGTLATGDHPLLSTHLDECLSCVSVRRDLELIVKLARELRDDLSLNAPVGLRLALFSKDLRRAAVT